MRNLKFLCFLIICDLFFFQKSCLMALKWFRNVCNDVGLDESTFIHLFVHLMGLFTLKLTSEKFSGIIFIIVSFLCFLFLKLLICKYWMICNRWNAESDLRIQLPFINSNTKENWKNVQSLLTVIIFCFGKCNYFLKNTLWRTVWRFIKKLQIELS